MKQLNTSKLRRLLLLTTAVLLLTFALSGCFGGDDTDDQVNNLPTGTEGTEAPTDAPTEEPTEAPTEAPAVMGTVNADNLNVRNLPSMDSEVLKQLDVNTRVEILEQETIGDIVWGRIADGWVNMNYVTLDGSEPVAPSDPTEPADTPETPEATEPADDKEDDTDSDGKTGTVTASALYIRKGAGSSYDTVGTYKKGDKVTILETKGNWGRTDKGWISLKYVDGVSGSETTTTTTSTIKANDTVTINTGALNIREGAGSSYDDIGTYTKGQKVKILEVKNGWGRTDKGWISLKYVTLSNSGGTTTNAAEVEVGDTVVINASSLNIRKGAGTSYDKVGSYAKGDKVEILEIKGSWGRTDKGWIGLNYVSVVSSGTNTTYTTGTGKVTASTLNIRKGAGTSYDKVGSYVKGDKVEIKEVSGSWGRTDKGWISLKYVDMD